MLNKEYTDRISKVDEAIELEIEIKNKKAKLDKIKAELQSEALAEMENRNSKYLEVYGTRGIAVVSYKEKCEVDNLDALQEIFGSVLDGKVKREESVKITLDSKFKSALIALYKNEFENVDLELLMRSLGLDDKAVKVALKKLKGDYVKDIATLKSLGVDITDGAEEELDAIKQAKNFELVSKYIDVDAVDLEKVKRAISVEDTLAIGLTYNEDVA